jgi:hypothetical protein
MRPKAAFMLMEERSCSGLELFGEVTIDRIVEKQVS